MKTYKTWVGTQMDLLDYLGYQGKPVEVDEELYMDQLNCVPPAYHKNSLLQVGEVFKTVDGIPHYFTFSSHFVNHNPIERRYFFIGILPEFKQ